MRAVVSGPDLACRDFTYLTVWLLDQMAIGGKSCSVLSALKPLELGALVTCREPAVSLRTVLLAAFFTLGAYE